MVTNRFQSFGSRCFQKAAARSQQLLARTLLNMPCTIRAILEKHIWEQCRWLGRTDALEWDARRQLLPLLAHAAGLDGQGIQKRFLLRGAHPTAAATRRIGFHSEPACRECGASVSKEDVLLSVRPGSHSHASCLGDFRQACSSHQLASGAPFLDSLWLCQGCAHLWKRRLRMTQPSIWDHNYQSRRVCTPIWNVALSVQV